MSMTIDHHNQLVQKREYHPGEKTGTHPELRVESDWIVFGGRIGRTSNCAFLCSMHLACGVRVLVEE